MSKEIVEVNEVGNLFNVRTKNENEKCLVWHRQYYKILVKKSMFMKKIKSFVDI